jgi:hypothetical protein
MEAVPLWKNVCGKDGEPAGKKPTPRLCKQHRSVNPGQCPACVLAEYYEKKLAVLGEEIEMLRGTIDLLTARGN